MSNALRVCESRHGIKKCRKLLFEGDSACFRVGQITMIPLRLSENLATLANAELGNYGLK